MNKLFQGWRTGKAGKAVALFAVMVLIGMSSVSAKAATVPSKQHYLSGSTMADPTLNRTHSLDGIDGHIRQQVYFGKKYGSPQVWYLAGYQNGGLVLISDVNNPILTNQAYKNSTSEAYYNGQTVYSNHYGNSDLRNRLKSIAKDTNYFSAAEQKNMKTTTYYNKDTNNDSVYELSDVLYAPYGMFEDPEDIDGDEYIYVGGNSEEWLSAGFRVSLQLPEFGNQGEFWLRCPAPLDIDYDEDHTISALFGAAGDSNYFYEVNTPLDVVTAFSLNTKNVLFASTATPDSETPSLSRIMTFRMKAGTGSTAKIKSGYAKKGNTVTVTYNTADNASSSAGSLYLYVQGKDSNGDFVKAKRITASATFKPTDFLSTLTSFDNCEIWLEKKYNAENVVYALNSTACTTHSWKGDTCEICGLKCTHTSVRALASGTVKCGICKKTATSVSGLSSEFTAASVTAPSSISYGEQFDLKAKMTTKSSGKVTYSWYRKVTSNEANFADLTDASKYIKFASTTNQNTIVNVLTPGSYSFVCVAKCNGKSVLVEKTVPVKKAVVTITVDDLKAHVGRELPKFTYTVTGLVKGDALKTKPVLKCSADGSKTGTFTITASGAVLPNTTNYDKIVYKSGKLSVESHLKTETITPATTKADGKVVTKCSSCGKTLSTATIKKISKVTLKKTKAVYTGKAITPGVIVKDSAGKVIDAQYYTVAYKNNKSVGKAKAIITFKGRYKGSVTKKFTINPKGTKIKSVTPSAKALTVKLNKQAKETTGYQIQVATDAKFKKNVKNVLINKNSTVTKKITKLKAKTKYYVRVRTFKKVGSKKYYSSWSKYSKAVKTK